MVVARAGGRLCGPALRHRPAGAGAGARDDIGPGAGRADRRRGRRPRPPPGPAREPEDRFEGERDVLLWGLLVAFATAVVLSIPFAVSGRWGLLGVGFNNDLGLHLAWAEWLRSGFGPAPEAGYPLGPHALADAVAAVPGIGLGQAFVGEIFAIGILTSLTALAALPGLGPARRVLGAVLVAASYLAASYYAQGAFKETAEALFVLAVALALRDPAPLPAGAVARLRYALPYLALAGGVLFAYSFAGLAWPIAVVALWSLTVPQVRRALAPRSLIRFLLRPTTLIVIALVAGIAVLTTVVGPFGFGTGFNRVAGSNTYGPVSPVEALGVWWAPNYRLDAPGESTLPWLAAAIGGAALAAGMIWWARRRDLSVPLAFTACALLYFVSLPFTGDYSQAKALMIGAPLAMLIAVRPLLSEITGPSVGIVRAAWAALAVVFIGGAVYSSFIVLRDGPVGPPGARLRAAVLPADPARETGPLRGPGPLRRLQPARRRHPRAAGRVPRPGDLAEPGKAVRHRRRLQPDRLRLVHEADPQPLPLRDHRPRRLEQPGAAELPADRRDPLVHPLGTGRQGSGGTAGADRGDRPGGAGGLRVARDPRPAQFQRAGRPVPGGRGRAEERLGGTVTC